MKHFELSRLTVLLWNEQTHEWRIESAERMVQANTQFYLGLRESGFSPWIVLALANTVEECALIRQKLTEALDRPLE
jgi:hypothetical protein